MNNNAAPSRLFLYGLFFSATTMMFWGTLPIALKLSSGFADPITLTWMRFTVAGALLFVWQKRGTRIAPFKALTKVNWIKLVAAATLLILNYTCYAWSLNFLDPEAAQLGMQSSPLFLALGGLIFLKEKIYWQQWVCFAALFAGLLIFFHPVLEGHYKGNVSILITGFIIVLFASFVWSIYALLQKSLFRQLTSGNILFFIYLYAAVTMLPFTSPSKLLHMNFQDTLVALFCCLNTVFAYGAFSQALRYWQTVQVSAVIAMTPVISYILTILCLALGWWPSIIVATNTDWLSISGLLLVVIAAISVQFVTASLQHKQAKLQISESHA